MLQCFDGELSHSSFELLQLSNYFLKDWQPEDRTTLEWNLFFRIWVAFAAWSKFCGIKIRELLTKYCVVISIIAFQDIKEPKLVILFKFQKIMWGKKKSNPFYGYENKYLYILKRLEAGHFEATVSTDWASFISLPSHSVLNQNQKQIRMDGRYSQFIINYLHILPIL